MQSELRIKNTAIVVTDFRLPMLIAAYQLCMRLPGAELFVHESALRLNDFGDNSPQWYKRLKLKLAGLYCKISILKNRSDLNPIDEFGIQSSLISITNNSRATQEAYSKIFENLRHISSGAAAVADEIVSRRFDCVAIFNGRLASTFPIARRCEIENIKIFYYEYGNIPFHFTFSKNRIHDTKARAEDAIKLFQNPNINPMAFDIMQNASENITEKLKNKFSMDLTQHNNKAYDYCLFLGSPHEFLSVHKGTAMTNVEIVEQVCKMKSGLIGAVRAHPNQINDPSWRLESGEIQYLCQLNNVDYFSPECKINSHSLISNSKLTVVAGSSIAVDAVILGAEVEFVSNSIYSEMFQHISGTKLTNSNPIALLQLLSLTLCVWQVAYHPRYLVLLRLLHFLDVKISKPPVVGSRIAKQKTSKRFLNSIYKYIGMEK